MILDSDIHALVVQRLVHVGKLVRRGGVEHRLIGKFAAHFLPIHRDLGDLALIHVGLELRETYFRIALRLRTLLEKHPQEQG